MSLVVYYQFSEGEFTPCTAQMVKTLNNPGAVCTVDRVMVINPKNSSFSIEESEKIIEFVKSLNK